MLPASFGLRPATPADAAAIAAVQTTSWAETYRGHMPGGFLDQMTGEAARERRALQWQHTLAPHMEADRTPDIVTVAEQAGRVVAFASAGATRLHTVIPGDYDAELYTLYALKSVHGLGLGRRLVAASAAALHVRGFVGLALWVLDVNPTRAFYRHLGGQELGRKTDEVPGGTLTEVALGWRDLTALLAGGPASGEASSGQP
ncbi:GNAT family N-acetyltransferase [Deinococcus altitudinis]|uniref:GNAT family N-acetyltransferase n=1 Tax=Deinococcus altitudinis TaxID=468914 RepID=UPI0038923A88